MLGSVSNALIAVGALGSDVVAAALSLAVAAVAFSAGLKLRQLDPLGRTLYTILAGIVSLRIAYNAYLVANDFGASASVLVLPLLVTVLFLLILWGSKATVVFSPHYREVVIPATPHIVYKTSRLLIALVILLLALVIAMIIGSIASG